MTLNGLSLFSGIGGLRPLDLGLERAGIRTVGQVEIDPWCRRVLAKHWPDVPRHDDVRTAAEWWLSEERPHVDVVHGGPPCQPFSSAGIRRGVGDERWGWPWFAAVVRAVRPRWVVVENVADLVRDNVAWGWLLGDLAALGFDADWSVLPACAFGAPHPRERVFLLAHAAQHHVADQGEGPKETRGLRAEPRGGRRFTRTLVQRWLPEPQVGRVADRVPLALVESELHALGNAVVPQVAEHVGRLIVAADRQGAA